MTITWTGGEVRAVGVCCALLLLLTAPTLGDALDPNGGYIAAGDSIGFNIAQGQVVLTRARASWGRWFPSMGRLAPGGFRAPIRTIRVLTRSLSSSPYL